MEVSIFLLLCLNIAALTQHKFSVIQQFATAAPVKWAGIIFHAADYVVGTYAFAYLVGLEDYCFPKLHMFLSGLENLAECR